MIAHFAVAFSNLEAAEAARRFVETCHHEGLINLAASVVIAKGEDGRLSEHDGKAPGPRGAVMAGLVGGILGMLGGPAVAALGVAAGGVSGGWFDLLRVQDRDAFMHQVASQLNAGKAALLGEAIDPSEEAKRLIGTRLSELGGDLIGKSS